MPKVDINGPSINGILNKDNKINSKVMSMMPYHFVIVKYIKLRIKYFKKGLLVLDSTSIEGMLLIILWIC